MKNFTLNLNGALQCLMTNNLTTKAAQLSTFCLIVCTTTAMANAGKRTDINNEHLPIVAFTQHPAPKVICAGAATTFSVIATGTGTLTYQWQVSTNGGGAWNPVTNGSTYDDVTTATLKVLVAASAMNTYQYRCQVTDNSGNYNSNPATLSLNTLPVVKTGNGSVSICASGGGSISAQVFANINYQWQVSTNGGGIWNNLTDGTPYSGTSTDLLTISSGATLNGNLYRYVATHSVTGCQATSDHDTLHVFQPVVNTQPVNTAVCTGSNAVLSVAATSPTNLMYQWKGTAIPLNALTEAAPYSGTATNSLTITGTTTAMNGFRYQVTATDAFNCAVNSTIVTLNVYSPLVINTQPRDTFICANTTINNAFRVTMAAGSGPLTYQWQTDNGTNGVNWAATGTPVTNTSITNALTITTPPITMNGYRYRVSVTGTCGSVLSNEVVLRVLADGTWRGTTSTEWHNAANWCGGVPTSITDVLIPAWAPRMPEISTVTDTAYSRALHIENMARLTISGGVTTMSGPFNIEGTVAYTAATDQQVLPAAHWSLEIMGGGNKYMQSNVDIGYNLQLGGNAKLVTGSNILTMKAGSNTINGTTFNGLATSWIVTGNGNSGAGNTGLGGLRIEQIDASDINVLYPIGATSMSYNPIRIANIGTIDDFTIAVNDQLIPGGALLSGIERTWFIGEATPGGSNVTIALRWGATEEQSSFDRTQTEIIRSDGAAIVQNSPTGPSTGTDPYNRGATGFTSLTQFSVASYLKVLPITLSAFSVKPVNKTTALLTWKSDNREEGGIFVVQRAAANTSFTDIGIVKQEAGRTVYEFTDNKLATGITRYRLKLTAPSQEAQYSRIVQVDNQSSIQKVELRPTITAKATTTLYMFLSQQDKVSLTITDVLGRIQWVKTMQLDKGEHNLPLNIERLTKGLYYIRVTGNNTQKQIVHLVKQ